MRKFNLCSFKKLNKAHLTFSTEVFRSRLAPEMYYVKKKGEDVLSRLAIDRLMVAPHVNKVRVDVTV